MVSKNTNGWAKWVVLGLVVIILAILAHLLFKVKETHVSSNGGEISRNDAVSCISEKPENAFFNPKQEGEIKHSIKIIFEDGAPSKISYDFSGLYDSGNIAESVEARAHTDYNLYMGEKGVSANTLSPTFFNMDNEVKISLYTDVKNLINVTIPFFFLDMDDFQKVRSYSVNEFVGLYEKKGFSCTILE